MTLAENHTNHDENYDEDELRPPPRILFWGLIAAILLAMVGILTAIFIFREVLSPGQQQRIIDALPFMSILLPPQPAPDTVLPTVAPVNPTAAMDLLNLSIDLETPPVETGEATETTIDASPTAITSTATPTPQPREMLPTSTPTPSFTTPAPTPTDAPMQSAQVATPTPDVMTQLAGQRLTWAISHLNTGFRWERQTWNNCGPTNITMAMSFYGWTRGQDFARNFLRPNAEDRNVSPEELVRFVNDNSNLRALYRVGGDLGLLRALINRQFAVVIERSHMFQGYDWLGHYQTLVGYDDTQRIFTVYDSFLGADTIETYTDVDSHWRNFNRVFIVVYQPDREAELFTLLGELADQRRAAEIAFDVAQAEARANPQDPFAWFNMGSSLVLLGRYQEASVAYDQATSLGLPWRMLWYQFGPYKAFYEVGRHQDILAYVNNTFSTDGGQDVEEAYYWQGRALLALGRRNEALAAFQQALSKNRYFADARQALTELGA